MRHFCKNQYWRRMWIIQEVVLAVKATIYCCSYEVDWQCFTQLVSDAQVVVRYGYLPYHNGDAKEFLKSPAAVVARTKSEWSGGLLPLITLLPTFRHHEATDFRDKVYALRGLSVEISRIPVDYCISPEELLKQVVFEVCNSWPPDSRWTTASIKEFITTMGVMLEADHSNIDIKAVQLQRDNDLCRWPTYIEHPMFDRSKSETQPHVLTSIERNPLKLGQLWDFITTLLHRLTRLQPDILLNFYKPSIASFKLVARRPATKEALMLWREGLDVAVRPPNSKQSRSSQIISAAITSQQVHAPTRSNGQSWSVASSTLFHPSVTGPSFGLFVALHLHPSRTSGRYPTVSTHIQLTAIPRTSHVHSAAASMPYTPGTSWHSSPRPTSGQLRDVFKKPFSGRSCLR